MNKAKETLIALLQDNRLDPTELAGSPSKTYNETRELANIDRDDYDRALTELLDSRVIIPKFSGYELNEDFKRVASRIELLEASLDVNKLANIARLSYDRNYTLDYNRNAILLKTLLKVKHLTPFEFFNITIKVEIPIYIARQLLRYRAGVYMERSLRRYQPDKRAEDNALDSWYNSAIDKYNELLASGYKKEQARAVLPLDTPTVLICRWNYRELAHIFDERLSSDTQTETRELVKDLYSYIRYVDPAFISAYEAAKP